MLTLELDLGTSSYLGGTPKHEDAIFYAPLKDNIIAGTQTGTIQGAFKRPSTATYIDKMGVLRTAAIDEPRIQSCGLLLEGAATNLIVSSNDFTNHWSGSTTVTPNYAQSPDGTTNASRAHGGDSLYAINLTVTEDTDYTFSWWTKHLSGISPSYSIRNRTASSDIIPSTQYEAGSNWTRQCISFHTPIGCISTDLFVIRNSGSDILIYGAQLEKSAFETSYIPTNGAAATRASESADSAGNGVSWLMDDTIKQTLSNTVTGGKGEGTVFLTMIPYYDYINTSVTAAMITANDNVNTLMYTNKYNPTLTRDGTNYSLTSQSTFSFIKNTNVCLVSRFSTIDNKLQFVGANNGSLVYGTEAMFDGSFPLKTYLRLWYANPYPACLKDFAIYDKYMTDEEIEDILGIKTTYIVTDTGDYVVDDTDKKVTV